MLFRTPVWETVAGVEEAHPEGPLCQVCGVGFFCPIQQRCQSSLQERSMQEPEVWSKHREAG